MQIKIGFEPFSYTVQYIYVYVYNNHTIKGKINNYLYEYSHSEYLLNLFERYRCSI